MLVSRILRARHTAPYTPMIHFLGQRSKLDHDPHPPAPHPMAPREIAEDFQSFLAKLQSSSSGPGSPSSTPKGQSTEASAKGHTGGQEAERDSTRGPLEKKPEKPADFDDFWDAPEKLWMPREVTEREMEAVMSGGATDIRSGP